MRRGLPIALLVIASSLCFSQDPFDGYIASVKKGKTDAEFARFVKECGAPTTELPIYAVSVGGGWKIVRDLPKAVYDTESDLLTTAELIKGTKRTRALNLWSLDSTVGYEQNTFLCFESDRHVRFLLAKTYSLPVEGMGDWWCFREKRSYDGSGHLISKKGSFFDKTGSPIAKPELDKDQVKWIAFVPGDGSLDDLKLPAELR